MATVALCLGGWPCILKTASSILFEKGIPLSKTKSGITKLHPVSCLAQASLLLYHALIFSLFLPLPWGALIISWVLKRNSDQFPAFSGKETGLERGSNWSKINTASFIYSLNQEHSLPFKIWLKCHLTRDIWLHLKQISLIILLCYYPLCVFTLYHNL